MDTKRLPAGTPKSIRLAAHRQKMMGKHFRRQETGVGYFERQLAKGKRVFANLSKNHELYGCHPSELESVKGVTNYGA